MAIACLQVVNQGDHFAQIHKLLEALALISLPKVVNGAVVAIVLPGALEIIERLPAAEPFGALVVLQPEQLIVEA